MNHILLIIGSLWAIFKTGTGNREMRTGNGERGTGNGERGIFKTGIFKSGNL